MDTTVQLGGGGGRVLLLPFPGMQGHANPMLQLGHRLAYHGLRPTLVLTRHVLSTTAPSDCPFPVAAISDGFDAGGIASCPDTAEYLRRMEAAGSDTLARLLLADDDVRVLVYDSHLPWARRVARHAGVAAAAFMTQMCAVDVVYGEARAGRVALPLADGSALRRRGVLSVDLGPEDVPPFVAKPEWYPAFTDSALGQFDELDQADDVLVNSFRELEPTIIRPKRKSIPCFNFSTPPNSPLSGRPPNSLAGVAAGQPLPPNPIRPPIPLDVGVKNLLPICSAWSWEPPSWRLPSTCLHAAVVVDGRHVPLRLPHSLPRRTSRRRRPKPQQQRPTLEVENLFHSVRPLGAAPRCSSHLAAQWQATPPHPPYSLAARHPHPPNPLSPWFPRVCYAQDVGVKNLHLVLVLAIRSA
ncbi:hypothetical protein QYE76_038235 [Lolium multiflorum]|uniref:Uncharacterized protein n=1 Tax=Lolium multiflorum TaxID=4521 RepID=A0AAD8WQQ8_LOLMU|nr:hypothetical protein QYE76_038235 [Lolium multiflorum]